MESDHKPAYTLRVASSRVGLCPRTLRIYEEAGLVSPARIGNNDQRLYSDQDLQWLRCIRDMIHGEGLTVVAIRRLLDFAPCWEVRRCGAQQAAVCAPNLNIPHNGGAVSRTEADADGTKATAPAHECPVLVKIIYGVEEFGGILPCSRCIHAERTARKVAGRYPGQVCVVKVDMMSEEASHYGVLLPPTIVVNDKVVASGQGVSEARLEGVIEEHLKREE